MKDHRVAHYSKGNSDKVYAVSIVPRGSEFQVIARWGKIWKSPQSQTKGTFSSKITADTEAARIFRTKTKKGYQDIESSAYTGPLAMDTAWLKSSYDIGPSSAPDPSPQAVSATSLSDEVYKVTKDLLIRGQRIKAVKTVRGALNCDLATGKEVVADVEKTITKAERDAYIKTLEAEREAYEERDFEVVCQDNLGIEDGFDEGVTYVAEPHNEDDLIWVWDRNAVKRECFAERFKQVREGETPKFDFRPLTGKEKIRITGEPMGAMMAHR